MGVACRGSGGTNLALMMMRWELQSLRAKVAKGEREQSRVELLTIAAERMRLGLTLDRPQAAAILGVHPKKLQRMEARGELVRCSELSGVVRYAASDVERLASARRKES